MCEVLKVKSVKKNPCYMHIASESENFIAHTHTSVNKSVSYQKCVYLLNICTLVL